MELRVIQDGAVVHVIEWSSGSLSIGRAADNGLILRDPDVSGHHAVLFREGGSARCRDLGSTNGLFLNGERVVEATLSAGDQLTFGGLVVQLMEVGQAPVESWLVRPQNGPVAQLVESGMSLDADPGAMFFVEDGGVWLDRGEDPERLAVGQPFLLGDDRWVLEPSTDLAPTVQRHALFPYRLEVDLTGNEARMEHDGLDTVLFRASARVSLLYMLARTTGEWVDDQVVGTGVWGREWARQGTNNLNVLVHRVRKQAASVGFDKRFVDRRRGSLRLVVAEAIARG